MKKILEYRIKWIFFATSHGKSPSDRICGSVKHHFAKRSLQRPMISQILDYQARLNVCEEEMSQIKFSGISKETMGGVHKSFVEWFSRGNTVPGTQRFTTSYHYHHPKLRTSHHVKTSLMLILSNCVISDQ